MYQIYIDILKSIIFGTSISLIYYYFRKQLILASKYVKEELCVPTGVAPILIGKKGKQIKEIKFQSGSRIRLTDTTTHLKCTISGDIRSVQIAKFLIKSLINDYEKSIEQTCWIPNDAVGYIIGSNGRRIKQLRRSCGTQIKFLEKYSNDANTLISIKGFPESVRKTKLDVEKMIKKFVEEKRIRGKFADKRDYSVEGWDAD